MSDWQIFRGTRRQDGKIEALPPPPPWRRSKFEGEPLKLDLDLYHKQTDSHYQRGATYESDPEERNLVNTALYLRRPLLITGKPGLGKSSLAYAVSYELNLGPVLLWPITTRTSLQDGLYRYDAIARLQAGKPGEGQENFSDIGKYIRLGPLGTALLPYGRPRVLLIDEIDKSDIDLPNDLLNIFEEGEYEIPELMRLSEQANTVWVSPHDSGKEIARVEITEGKVFANAFPFVVMTSNGERDFPPAFLRRCIRLDLSPPDVAKMKRIVQAQFGFKEDELSEFDKLIEKFVKDQEKNELATDQLLNAIYLRMNGSSQPLLDDTVLRRLNS